jgi:hypothetical protein
MVKEDTRDHNSSEYHHEEDDNPFIAFRRFADEQMSAMLHSLLGLPSAFESRDRNHRWTPYDELARQKTMESWGASPEHTQAQHSSSSSTHPDTLSSSQSSQPTQYRCPYAPQREEESASSYSFAPNSTTTWLLPFLMRSRHYSPIYLERHPLFGMPPHGLIWRNAFEDLLAASSGHSMHDDKPRHEDDGYTEPMKWVWSIIEGSNRYTGSSNSDRDARCQGVKRELATREAENDADEDRHEHGEEEDNEREMTELDLYEHFLEGNRRHEAAQRQKPQSTDLPSPFFSDHFSTSPSSQDSHSKTKAGKDLGIVSTLTTTERVTLPDGTVHTKMVLKKRFADGREESSETVHSTQAGHVDNVLSSKVEPKLKSESDSKDENGKERKEGKQGRGWFWS